jgi:hypothetical protein
MRRQLSRKYFLPIFVIAILVFSLTIDPSFSKGIKKPKKDEKLVQLKVEGAEQKIVDVNWQQESGWAIYIEATIDRLQGLTSPYLIGDNYPDLGDLAYFVLSEVDDCFSPIAMEQQVCCLDSNSETCISRQYCPNGLAYDTANQCCYDPQNTFSLCEGPVTEPSCLNPDYPSPETRYLFDGEYLLECPDNELYLEVKTDMADMPGAADQTEGPGLSEALTRNLTLAMASTYKGNIIEEISPIISKRRELQCVGPVEEVFGTCEEQNDCYNGATCENSLCVGSVNRIVGQCESQSDCPASFTCQEAIFDGFGIGAPDDNFRGLIILSDTGIGRVLVPYDESDNEITEPLDSSNVDDVKGYMQSSPITARNLAPLLTTVAYDLSARDLTTKIRAMLVATTGMFIPIVLFDDCIGGNTCRCNDTGPEELPICDAPPLYSVDGSPWEPMPMPNPDFAASFIHELQQQEVELKFMIVDGVAPGLIEDMNDDGAVDEEDVELLGDLEGFRIVSNVESYKVSTRAKPILPGIMFDTDGNGVLPKVAPVASGRVIQPPR